MLLGILEFGVENKKKYLEKNYFGNMVSDLWKIAKIVRKIT